jgi:hypothetical protein
MQTAATKMYAGLLIMVTFLAMSFIAQDVACPELIASISILAALYTYRLTQKFKTENNG